MTDEAATETALAATLCRTSRVGWGRSPIAVDPEIGDDEGRPAARVTQTQAVLRRE